MANLLLDPGNWRDTGYPSPPPACWNGYAYIAVNQEQDIELVGAVSAGDTIACTVTSTDGIGVVKIVVDGFTVETWGPVTEPTKFSYAASAGMILQIDGGLGCSSDTLTLTPTPDPAFYAGDLVRQWTTHRIYRGIDSPIKCYVRNELGRVDLTPAKTIQAKVYRYGMTWPFATLDATGDANGLVQFTVPASLLRTSGLGYDYGLYVQPYNLIRFDVFADDQLVYTALMEIV